MTGNARKAAWYSQPELNKAYYATSQKGPKFLILQKVDAEMTTGSCQSSVEERCCETFIHTFMNADECVKSP